MSGMSNYDADNLLNWETGLVPFPALGARYLALFTAVGTDAGTGFTEVSGAGYARQQVAGNLTTNAATTTSSAILGFASVPSWMYNSAAPTSSPGIGMTAYDSTNGNVLGTVLSVSATQVTLNANSLHAVSSGDTINFSIFPQATGTGPSSAASGAAVTFGPSAADWTSSGSTPIIGWGLYDASSSGNLIRWGYLGGYSPLPCTISAASPAVFTAHAHGIASGGEFVFSTEIAGTAPTVSGGSLSGLLTAASVTTDTLTVTGLNTSTTGDGVITQVLPQSVPNNTSLTIPAGSITLLAA